MPKGVEHRHSSISTTMLYYVSSSVMPKGVEHGLAGVPPRGLALCRVQ